MKLRQYNATIISLLRYCQKMMMDKIGI